MNIEKVFSHFIFVVGIVQQTNKHSILKVFFFSEWKVIVLNNSRSWDYIIQIIPIRYDREEEWGGMCVLWVVRISWHKNRWSNCCICFSRPTSQVHTHQHQIQYYLHLNTLTHILTAVCLFFFSLSNLFLSCFILIFFCWLFFFCLPCWILLNRHEILSKLKRSNIFCFIFFLVFFYVLYACKNKYLF